MCTLSWTFVASRDVLMHFVWAVAIRVVLHRDGTVEKAEIVDDRRYRTDPAYRTIALSARNAVLLSSPLSLPAARSGVLGADGAVASRR